MSEVATTPTVIRQLPFAIKAMRPSQWTKNGLVVLALVFASKLTDVFRLERVALAFAAFCLVASATYIFNDIADREKDRRHPAKSKRPIASGNLTMTMATVTGLACLAVAAALCYLLLSPESLGLPPHVTDPFAQWGGSSALFAATLLGYWLLNVGYSLWLKHLVIWDVFAIAAGFVLRAIAGAFAAVVIISPWFYLCTVFLALFLALGKRRAELVHVASVAQGTRTSLQHYTVQMLDMLLMIVASCALVSYSLYTFEGVPSSSRLMITIPFLIFGLFRYIYLVYAKGEGERPDEVLFSDKQILGAVLVCGAMVIALLYGGAILHALGRG